LAFRTALSLIELPALEQSCRWAEFQVHEAIVREGTLHMQSLRMPTFLFERKGYMLKTNAQIYLQSRDTWDVWQFTECEEMSTHTLADIDAISES